MKRISYRKLCAVVLIVACGSDVGPAVPVASVTVTPASAPLAAGATLQLSATPKDANGTALTGRTITWATNAPAIATVNGSGLVSGKSPGPVTITATSEGESGTASLTVSPGPAARLAVAAQPTTATAGNPVSPAVQVVAQDALGNTATSFTGTITIAIGANPGSGTLTGTKSVAAVAGLAAFNDLSIEKAGTGYTLAAAASGLTGATSNAFNIVAAGVSAAQSSLNALPRTISASLGSSSTTVTVMALDAYANPVAGVAVLLSVTGGGNTLTQPTGPTNAAGIATGTLSSTVVGAKTVSASVAGVGITETDTVTVGPGPAVAPIFTVQPSNAVAGASITPAIQVTARDAFGNDDTAFTGNVTLAISTNPGGGTLAGTLTQPAVAGVASFNNLHIDKVGTGYVLQASASGLTPATSNAFNITASGPDHLVFFVQPADVVAGATLQPVQVEIQDASGNRVSSATNSITVSIANNPGGGVLSGTKTLAAVAGVATFASLSIDRAGSGYTLAAASGSLGGSTSSGFNVTPGSAIRLSFFVEPSSATAGATLTPAIQIEVQDGFGNRVTTATNTVTVALAANPGGGTLSGTLSHAAVAGIATFNDLSVDTAAAGYRLSGSAAGLTPDTSAAFTISAGAATQLVFTAQPTTTAATASITPVVQVTAQDGLGNTASSFVGNVSLAIGTNPCGGSLSGTTTAAAVVGIATFSNLSIAKACAGYTLAASATGLGGATSNAFTITVGPATAMAFLVQPTGTTGGATIAPAVQVEIRDAGGNRVTSASTSISVAIANNPGSGVLSGTSPVSAVNGVANFANLSIDKAGVGYTLAATATGLSGATSTGFTIAVGSAAKLSFLVQPSNTISGATITPAVQVEVQDAGGNRVTTGALSIALAILNNPGGGALSGTNPVTSASGVASFANLSIDKSGIGYTLQATSGGLTAATSTSFNIISGAADHLAFFVQPTDHAAGATIAPAVQVEVQDGAGNRVTSATTSITVAILDNPGGGTLSGTKIVSAVAGVATFSSLSIDKAGTGYSLVSTATALTAAVSSEFNIAPGAASRLSFLVEPVTTTAGVTIVPAVQVEILDAFANRVATANNNVTVALLNAAGATLSGTKTRAASGGVATFNNLSVDKSGTGYRLRTTSSGLTPDTTATFAITPGAATQLVFTTQPVNTPAGATITPAVQVTARDGLGNTDTSFTGNVTVAIGANPGSGVLSGTTLHAAVSGVATFSGLSIDKSGTGYTLTAASTGLGGATSSTFNITVGAATKLAFLVQPSNTNGGATINPAVQVEIQDAGGNRVTGAGNSITLAFGVNPKNGFLGGTTSRGAVSGVSTFNDLTVDSAATGYTLTAAASGLTGTTSTAFTVSVGLAHHLGFLVQPSNTGAGSPIAPAIQVEVRDLGGNRVVAPSHSIAMAIGNNPPPGGTLAGTTPVTSVNGLATFADLSINNPAVGYTLVASTGGLTSATSAGFDISIGGAAKLAFIVQPTSTTGGATISPAVQVEIQDAGGNRVVGATNSVTLGIGTNPNSGSLSGTKTVAGVAGVATFNSLSIDSAGTGYTLSATGSGLTGATSTAFNISVGAAVKLGFRQQPPNGTGGSTLTPAVQVEIQDAGGNRVTGATNSITVAIGTNPNNGTLSGITTTSGVAGLATFSTLKIDSAGTGYGLSAAASGLTDATSSAFNISVGAAAQLAYLTSPSDAVAGSAITPAVQVEIRDAGGNRVTGATTNVTLAIVANPGGSTLSGTNPKAAVSGVATFSNLSLNKVGSGYTLQATAASLTSVTSAGFAIAADGVDAGLSSLIAATDTIGQCAFSCLPGIHASTITVTVKDQFGNLVPESPVVLSANGTGNGFSPSATGNTDGSGVFTAAFNAEVVEAKTVSATAGGIAITQTATAAVMPALVGAGDIADCNSVSDDATANQLDSIPGVVFAAGDLVYPSGTDSKFATCYDPTWGRHKARTRPVIGNHEYDSSGTAAPYKTYFGASVADPLGNGYGYYSFDVGAWHVIVLNSDSAATNATSGQLPWLVSDLVGRTNQCVLAIWHRPLFTSGASGGGQARFRRLWQALQNAGAEVVINGHDHLYERFALQDSLGAASPSGMREFIAGTGGGESHSTYPNSPPNVEASDAANFSRGVLRLTLYPASYRWEFLHAQGQGTYTDSGIAACH